MRRIANIKRRRGQGLVEYALILALVALAVIVIAFVLGLGLQRVYGLIGGALGGHQDEHAKHTITIDSAQCIAVANQHQTGIWVLGQTDEPLGIVSGTTEFGTSVVAAYQGGYAFQPLLDANKADVGECPASIVIQATDGTIAAAPLVKVNE